ncbi:glycerophosphoryl diester phosphodiesterase membrane domain-containing protein [Thalassiella azotivora]
MGDQQGWAAPGDEQQAGAVAPPAGPGVPAAAPAGQQPWGAAPAQGWQQQGWQQQGWQVPVLRPGIVPLRPLGLGELYDGAFQALRTNPRTMLGVTAVVVLVMGVVDLLVSLAMVDNLRGLLLLDPADPESVPEVQELLTALGALGAGSLVSFVVSLLGIAVITGVLTLAVSQAVLGRRPPLPEVWARARGRIPALVGLTVLTTLATATVAVLPLLPGLVLVFLEPVSGALLLVVGVLGALAAGAWLYTRLALASPVLMLEGTGVTGAIRRSWQLTRGSFWRVLGILLLTAVLTAVAVAVVAGPFQLVAVFLGSQSPGDPVAAAGLSPLQLVLQSVGQVAASTVVYPFSAAVAALLYVDLRMRREGLDVQLAQQAQAGRG